MLINQKDLSYKIVNSSQFVDKLLIILSESDSRGMILALRVVNLAIENNPDRFKDCLKDSALI